MVLPETKKTAEFIRAIVVQDELMEVARKAIEVELVFMRNHRCCQPFRGNGLVIKEKGGKDSAVIRMGPEDAVRIGMNAIAEHLEKEGAENGAA